MAGPSALGEKALAEEVAKLRKGLDVDDPRSAAQSGALFDLGLAHALFTDLLPSIDLARTHS